MSEPTMSGGLRIIFSFFLALMVTAFIGVGVYTFHRPPDYKAQLRDFERQEQSVRIAGSPNGLTPADRDSLQAISKRRNAVVDEQQKALEVWGRSTSIILIVFATIIMAVSLVRADQLPVLTNGLLLGGIFLMVYGVGWIIATDTSVSRFVVITVAFAITLGLGYARFVQRRSATPVEGAGVIQPESVARLEQRVRDLENRMTAAATAFAAGRDDAPGG